MKSVLLLTPWFPNKPGDRQGNYIYESAAALSKLGVAVNAVVSRPWIPKGFERFKSEWERDRFEPEAFHELNSVQLVRHLSVPRNYLWQFSERSRADRMEPVLKSAARKYSPDIIHAHTEGMAEIAVQAGQAWRIPVVVTLHGINMAHRYLDSPSRRKGIGAALSAADRIILVGEPLRAFFRDVVGREDHFRVVPNGVLSPEVQRLRPALKDDGKIHFIAVTNLHEGKGIDIALSSLAMARSRGFENWKYTIVGDGPARASLITLVGSLGLTEKVVFVGVKPHDEIFGFLENADVFLLPSYRESFGIAYLEAMASGLLAIGVRGQGPEAFIEHEKTGILTEPRDANKLADCIVGISRRREQMNAIAAAGADVARAKFTWDAHAHDLLKIYESLVA